MAKSQHSTNTFNLRCAISTIMMTQASASRLRGTHSNNEHQQEALSVRDLRRSMLKTRSLSLHQVTHVLHSEVEDDYSMSGSLPMHDSEGLWSETVEISWDDMELNDAKYPFLFCSDAANSTGYERRLEIEQIFQNSSSDPDEELELNVLYNGDEKTCFYGRTSSLFTHDVILAENAPAWFTALPVNPSMKLRQGLVDSVVFEGATSFEVQICPGSILSETRAGYDIVDLGWNLIDHVKTPLYDENGSRRLRQHYKADIRIVSGDSFARHRSRALMWKEAYQEGLNSKSGCQDLIEQVSIVAESPDTIVIDLVDNAIMAKSASMLDEGETPLTTACVLSIVSALAAETDVCSIEPVYEMNLFNDVAQWITQSGVEEERPWFDAGLTGEGQVVAVSDSGIDTNNCYFWDASEGERRDGSIDMSRRKIVQYIPHWVVGDNTDIENGHGTHVAGTIAGRRAKDGYNESTGMADGIAPAAKIAFFDMGNGSKCCTFRSVTTLLETGKDAGAKVQNMSWGQTKNDYDGKVRDFDRYMYDHDDFLTVVAAGNSGQDHRLNTVGSPATSKNGIAVGASQSSGADIYQAHQLGPDYLAAFSSRGPSKDGRIKPDIVAPGLTLLSARALPNTIGECDPETRPEPSQANQGVSYKAGTSMASPVVTGNVAIIRQYLQDGYYPTGLKSSPNAPISNPSAALIKAIILNGAQNMVGAQSKWYGGGFIAVSPYDNHVGFGRVNLLHSLPLDSKNDFRIKAYDRVEITNTQEHEYKFNIDTTQCSSTNDVSITLVWTDPPAETGCVKCLINDLDLTVTNSKNGVAVFPNGRFGKDDLNNVERVRLDSIDHGDEVYVAVQASNLSTASQRYSLVVTGCVEEDVSVPVPATKAPVTPAPVAPAPVTPAPALVTRSPTHSPSIPLEDPTPGPTRAPSRTPTKSPTRSPTKKPTLSPTDGPTKAPIKTPTMEPTIYLDPTPTPVSTPSNTQIITTTYEGGSGEAGNMFDVHSHSSTITIANFHIHTSSTSTEIVEIYTRKSSHVNFERRPSAWTLIGEFSFKGQGYGTPTILPSNQMTPVTIEAQQTQSFYITLQNSNHMVYTIGNGDPIVASNNHLDVMEGVGKGYLFRGTVANRRWNGAIEYTVDGGAATTNAPTSSPIGSSGSSLMTTLDGGTSEPGNMFNIVNRHTTTQQIRITNFHIHTSSTGTETVEIFHRKGSHRNYERRPGAWTKINNNNSIQVQGRGIGQQTPLPPNSFEPVLLSPGEVHSFYVTLKSSTMVQSVGSTTGVDGETIVAENVDLAVMQGVGKKYLFGGNIQHCLWNGVVEYEMV